MIRRVVLIGCVLAASVAAGSYAVWLGSTELSRCYSGFPGSGCEVTDRYIHWGPIQAVAFALITAALLSLVRYLMSGARRWLVTTLLLATTFVVVPVALVTPAAFDDTGPVQLLSFLRD